jgi:competence protein ComEA
MRVRLAAAVSSLLVVLLALPASARPGGKGQRDIEGVINLNTATAAELELLPGIGPARVRAIVAYRQQHPFRTVEELVRIKGIGRKMVRRLRLHLTVTAPTTAQATVRPPPPAPNVPAR